MTPKPAVRNVPPDKSKVRWCDRHKVEHDKPLKCGANRCNKTLQSPQEFGRIRPIPEPIKLYYTYLSKPDHCNIACHSCGQYLYKISRVAPNNNAEALSLMCGENLRFQVGVDIELNHVSDPSEPPSPPCGSRNQPATSSNHQPVTSSNHQSGTSCNHQSGISCNQQPVSSSIHSTSSPPQTPAPYVLRPLFELNSVISPSSNREFHPAVRSGLISLSPSSVCSTSSSTFITRILPVSDERLENRLSLIKNNQQQ